LTNNENAANVDITT